MLSSVWLSRSNKFCRWYDPYIHGHLKFKLLDCFFNKCSIRIEFYHPRTLWYRTQARFNSVWRFCGFQYILISHIRSVKLFWRSVYLKELNNIQISSAHFVQNPSPVQWWHTWLTQITFWSLLEPSVWFTKHYYTNQRLSNNVYWQPLNWLPFDNASLFLICKNSLSTPCASHSHKSRTLTPCKHNTNYNSVT